MGKVVLAGDIGGTKTHLALFPEGERRKWIVDQKFPSSNYPNLIDIVKEFLATRPDDQVIASCFGIAGPVQGGVVHATNLPWVIDAVSLAKEMGLTKVSLINDLEANAYGIGALEEEELFVLNPGVEKEGNRALISAGTGLGEAALYYDGEKHYPFPSEGGHATFAPEEEIEIDLLRYLKKKYGHVSFERIVSGMGLANIYQFLVDEKIEKGEAKAPDPQVITEKALKNGCAASIRTVELFIQIYGAEAGNWALKMLALGGVYLGGGIAPKMVHLLKEKGFMKRFTGKGRFGPLLIDIPVRVILNENTALLGAATVAGQNE